MGKCKICASDTNAIFNIDFKKVSICEECASSIALQQITDVLTRTNLADDSCEYEEPKCYNCGCAVIKHDLLGGRCPECGCLIWPDGEEFDYTP